MASSTFFFKSVHLQVPVCSQCCELLGAEGLHAGPVTCLNVSSAVQGSAVLLGRPPAVSILCL